MKRIIAFLVMAILTIGYSHANAQSVKDFMKKRKEGAGESATERVDGEISKGINKGLDKIFGSDEEKSDADEAETPTPGDEETTARESNSGSSSPSGVGMNAILRGMGMSGTANVKDVYQFDAYIEMTITNYDEDGEVEESGKYISYVDADSPDYGIAFTDDDEEAEMLMIFDTENSLMLTLMESEGEKTGFAVGFDEEQMKEMEESYEEEEIEEVETNPYNIKKTGKSKKILGYSCDEYLTEDESSIVRMWVTDDLGKKVNKTFMKSSNFSGLFLYAYHTNGFVMEYDIEEKDDHERSVMTVTDIDVDNKSNIKTGGYTIMNMGAMEGMMEEED